MLPRPVVVSRRAAVGVVLLGAAGCSLDLDPSSDDPTFTPSSTASGGAGPTSPSPSSEPDADAALVAALVPAVSLAFRTVRAVARAHPALAAELAPLEALHRAHGRELGGLIRAGGPAVGAGEPPRRARALVVTAEARLQRQLVRGAAEAASGALAQLLASMAAGLAQHRSLL